MVIPTHIAEKSAAPWFRAREETRRFYTETLLHTESFIHKHFYTQTLSHGDVFHTHTQTHFHTETFTRKHFNTQTLLYTDSFTHTRFCMQMPFYRRTHTFTHKRFYTQTLFAHRHRRFSTRTLSHTDAFTHKHFYTRTLLHTDAFTRKHFYIQALLHTDATFRHFYTQTLFHTDPFTHRRFYTQTLLHTDASTETFTQRRSQSAAQLRDLSCKQRCANIFAMEMFKKSHKCTRPGSVPWSTHNPMQGIRSLRYKVSSAPWCRGWPQLPIQVGKQRLRTMAPKRI